MLRNENQYNQAANQAIINEKERVLRGFNINVGRLLEAPKNQEDIAKFCDLHNLYAQQIHAFRQKNLLTFQEADQIASDCSYLHTSGKLNSKQIQMLQDQAQLDYEVWHQYKRWCLLNTASNIFQLNRSEIETEHYRIQRALINVSNIFNECKAGELTLEQLRPIIIAMTNLLVDINIEIAQQPEKQKLQSLKALRDDVMNRLNAARKLGLVNGEDAYRISCAIDLRSISKPEFMNEKDEQSANLQIVEWKNYAANAGDEFAIRELNSKANDFILESWKQFLKDTTPKKTQSISRQ